MAIEEAAREREEAAEAVVTACGADGTLQRRSISLNRICAGWRRHRSSRGLWGGRGGAKGQGAARAWQRERANDSPEARWYGRAVTPHTAGNGDRVWQRERANDSPVVGSGQW